MKKKGRFIVLSRLNDKIAFPHGLIVFIRGEFLRKRVNSRIFNTRNILHERESTIRKIQLE